MQNFIIILSFSFEMSLPQKLPKIISVEGCVAAGKTRLLETLKAKGYRTYCEPEEKWEPFLLKFFQSNCGGLEARILQRVVTQDLINRHKQILLETTCNNQIVFIERSLLSGLKVFTAINQSLHEHSDWAEIIAKMEKGIREFENHITHVHLKLGFEAATKRGQKRQNPDTICQQDYLKKVQVESDLFGTRYCEHVIDMNDNKSSEDAARELLYLLKL